LWQQFQSLETRAQRDAFRDKYPDMVRDWEAEFRYDNPDVDAKLTFWGKGGKLQTMEAYNTVKQMAVDNGISMSQVGLEGLPPEEIIEDYFGYNKSVKDYGANTAESKLFLLEHPGYYKYWTEDLGNYKIETHIESLRISVKYGVEDDEYASPIGATSDDRTLWRTNYLTNNSDYRIARWKRDAYDDGFKESIIDDYAAYQEAGWGGDDDSYDAEWLLIADKNAGFDDSGGSALYEEMFRTGRFTDRARQDKILSNVPTPHVEDLYVNLYKSFPAYDSGRMATRCQYPELQAWGAKKFGWKAADCGDSQQITPYDYPDTPYGGVTIP